LKTALSDENLIGLDMLHLRTGRAGNHE